MRTWISGLGVAATLPVVGAAAALVMGVLNLPTDPVTATQAWVGAGGANSTVDVTLSNVPADFDVMNGLYPGWCMEDNHRPNAPAGSQVTLYDSTDAAANLPATYQGVPWSQVNWVLNHKQGTVADVQVAIWTVVGYFDNTFPPTAASDAMVAEAIASPPTYVPGDGELVAVLLFNDGIGPDGFQDTLIEVELDTPPPGGDGCTPGFWKRDGGKFGFRNWIPTGYTPGQDFDGVFGTTYFPDGLTLLESLTPTNNGGYGKVIWHGTAALLNAAHPDVAYPYTVDEVKAMVQAGNGDDLALANDTYCPLSRQKEDV